MIYLTASKKGGTYRAKKSLEMKQQLAKINEFRCKTTFVNCHTFNTLFTTHLSILKNMSFAAIHCCQNSQSFSKKLP